MNALTGIITSESNEIAEVLQKIKDLADNKQTEGGGFGVEEMNELRGLLAEFSTLKQKIENGPKSSQVEAIKTGIEKELISLDNKLSEVVEKKNAANDDINKIYKEK